MSAPAPAAVSSAPLIAPKTSPATATAAPARLVSIDALRGFDMFWIMGADALVQVVAKTWPVGPWPGLADQFEHKDWAGFGFYDLIFPLFVFVSGVSLVFSLGRIIAEQGRSAAIKRVLIRAAILFLLGIFYSGGLTNPWPNLRVLGVLQRIALAYAGAGVLFCFFRPRTLAAITFALLAGYWVLLTFVPVRDIALDKSAMIARFGPKPTQVQVRAAFDATTAQVTGRYEPGLNVTNHFDFNHLPGRLYDVYWDPEGILSTFPAIASCLLGVFAGLLLRRRDMTEKEKTTWLAVAGVVALALGFLWGLQFPVVKKIWTSSFVLVAGGWSLLLLSAFYYVVDVRMWRGWCRPFVWIGMNPITLYLLHGGIVNFNRVALKFTGGDVKTFFDTAIRAGAGDVVSTAATLGLVVLVAWFLYRRKIFLRV